ncbi:AlpA family phage regulatory protein [Stutzerimonas stutzeri]|uniref:helix-turn-helix transcriptional regulator n=1 Tax=Stutzerimonas sp. S1 TaxID=3030652 RepID=UPI002225A095|nr:AlpA family phage regulatory protein [Stutzerimonas sp. S1]MCW3149290.1 AlpA family phage regulatory protein [Stutzerimonas sp. S1]
MHSTLPLEGNMLISQSKLQTMLGKSRSGLYRLLKSDPEFPKPIKSGIDRRARCYYVADEVNAWLLAKMKERDAV